MSRTALCLAALTLSTTAAAQTPTEAVGHDADGVVVAAQDPLTLAGTAPENALLLRDATRDIIVGRAAEAAAALSLAAAQQRIGLDSDDTVAVLLRLASAMAVRGGADRLQDRCVAPVPATDATTPPPPPDAVTSLRCAIDLAVRALAARRFAEAEAQLASVGGAATTPADHPLAVLRRIALSLRVRVAPALDPERFAVIPVAAPRASTPVGEMGGVEAAAMYTTAVLWGGGFGLWLAGTAIRDDAGVHTLLLPLLGIGAGVTTAVFAHRDGHVRRGRALAVHAGMWLGFIAGGGVAAAANWSFDRDQVNVGSHALFLGSTAGMLLGAGISAATDARPGSVSFTFTTGLWTSYAGAMIEGAARTSGRSRFPAAGLLVGEGIGVATGMILSKFLEPTAAQARWMDLGAASGALIGALSGALVRRADAAPFLGSLVGMTGGLVLGYVLGRPSEDDRRANRERDGEEPLRPSAFVTPVEGGAVAGISL